MGNQPAAEDFRRREAVKMDEKGVPWFAPTRALAEEITACLLHKAYQLATVQEKGLPRRFVEGDI